jgi:hypothetical protein
MTLGKDDIGHHISQQYNQELENLRSHVLHMGGVVERQIADAISALEDGDTQLAASVVGGDLQVNALELNLDEECSRILARRQPAAGDLRLLCSVQDDKPVVVLYRPVAPGAPAGAGRRADAAGRRPAAPRCDIRRGGGGRPRPYNGVFPRQPPAPGGRKAAVPAAGPFGAGRGLSPGKFQGGLPFRPAGDSS